MTKGDVEDVNIVAYFFTIIEKEAYSSLKTLASPEKSIWIPYATLKELLLDYVKYTNFKCSKGEKFRKTIHRDIENSTTLLRCPNASRTQGYTDNSLRSCGAGHKDGHNFDKCLSCKNFHSFNSCEFHNSTCFKCDEIGHIQSVCNTAVHFASTKAKICNCYPIKLSFFTDQLSLSTTSKGGIESHSNPELSETQNHCGINIYNQSTSYQISHVIVLDMVCPDDSHIYGKISYKSEENMLSESNRDQKSNAVLIDADFSSDSLFFDEILNKSEENISE
ncbi:unnamed protein product [Schistosoma curassoni]|uniref:CCHC-type domain-containing protein n=1 Tax=Schistosoma curassoni TaxID=6186 RepID=A0A183KDB2_9TREM|nr:unnamed protein product [Schistosoma curassoni]